MALRIERDSYYRNGVRGNIIRMPEACRDKEPMADIITSNYCKVYGLDQDETGAVFPDYYMGFMYTYPASHGDDSEAYLFLSSHDKDEKLTMDEMLESVYHHTNRFVLKAPKVVSIRVNGPALPDSFEILNKDDLRSFEIFAIDVMFEKHGLKRVN